eukprot:COSAG02_NODE_34872_length_477_cov_0.785714_1_plen_109_part_01
MVAGVQDQVGGLVDRGLFAQVPPLVLLMLEELIEIAKDRQRWRQHVEEIAGNGRFGTQKANTAAQTAAEIDALPTNTILAYTDGGCFFKQKTAYEISECDWSSDVCSSD